MEFQVFACLCYTSKLSFSLFTNGRLCMRTIYLRFLDLNRHRINNFCGHCGRYKKVNDANQKKSNKTLLTMLIDSCPRFINFLKWTFEQLKLTRK